MSDVERYVAGVDPKLRPQFEKLRSVVRSALPEASETVKWGVPHYSIGGAGVASIAEYSGHVNLYLIQGAKIRSNLLEGTGKGMRHVTVRTLDDVHEGELTGLLEQAGRMAAEAPRPRKARRSRAKKR